MKNTFAVIYDFDGTLCPASMQEYGLLPELGMTGEEFWGIVDSEKKRVRGDPTLTYMRVLLGLVKSKKINMTRDWMTSMGKKIRYFEGVEDFFTRISMKIKGISRGTEVKHYVISSGLKELIQGCDIYKHFSNVFACEYLYGENGEAVFPKFCVNSTDKTQYVFRINKGMEEQDQGVHNFMSQNDRPVPFKNMVYIGDGMTDVPCMEIIRSRGGAALSVYNPDDAFSAGLSARLVKENRVDKACTADYREDGDVENAVMEAGRRALKPVKSKCGNLFSVLAG